MKTRHTLLKNDPPKSENLDSKDLTFLKFRILMRYAMRNLKKWTLPKT